MAEGISKPNKNDHLFKHQPDPQICTNQFHTPLPNWRCLASHSSMFSELGLLSSKTTHTTRLQAKDEVYPLCPAPSGYFHISGPTALQNAMPALFPFFTPVERSILKPTRPSSRIQESYPTWVRIQHFSLSLTCFGLLYFLKFPSYPHL